MFNFSPRWVEIIYIINNDKCLCKIIDFLSKMSFQNLNLVLKKVVNQPGWELQKQYLQILNLWQDLVSPKIAQNSRPHHLTVEVLWIAVSSSVWSQELSLQRYSLLKKLNTHLDTTLTDLRFSVAFWYQNSSLIKEDPENSILPQHPTQIQADPTILTQIPKGKTPLEAFQNWQESLKRRSQHLPLCPKCKSPTPQGEIDRWQKCYICFTKK